MVVVVGMCVFVCANTTLFFVFSKEPFEVCKKCTWVHDIYTSNCSLPSRDETINTFFTYDLQV